MGRFQTWSSKHAPWINKLFGRQVETDPAELSGSEEERAAKIIDRLLDELASNRES